MATEVRDNPDLDRYEIVVDDAVAGIVGYHVDGDRVTLSHTEVDDAYAGQGLGKTLVTGTLDDVAQRGLAVIPMCPFVRKVIARDGATYGHLVPEDVREELDLTQLP